MAAVPKAGCCRVEGADRYSHVLELFAYRPLDETIHEGDLWVFHNRQFQHHTGMDVQHGEACVSSEKSETGRLAL